MIKWLAVIVLLVFLGFILVKWFKQEERKDWINTTWDFAKQILPLQLTEVLVASLIMGRPGTGTCLIPVRHTEALVVGNSLRVNLVV